jgi:hypothetical protein
LILPRVTLVIALFGFFTPCFAAGADDCVANRLFNFEDFRRDSRTFSGLIAMSHLVAAFAGAARCGGGRANAAGGL